MADRPAYPPDLADFAIQQWPADAALGMTRDQLAEVLSICFLASLTTEDSPQREFVGLGLTGTSIAMALLYGVVKTGFAEELLFRGLIAGSLGRRLPLRWANLLQAVVFLLLHLLVLLVRARGGGGRVEFGHGHPPGRQGFEPAPVVADDECGSGVADQVGQPVGRVRRVERQIGGAAAEHGEQRDDQLRRLPQAEGHHGAGPGTQGP